MLKLYRPDLSGEAFEQQCARLFRLLGFKVKMTRKGPDDGIDFVATPIRLLNGYDLLLAEESSIQRQRLRRNMWSACLSGVALNCANLRGANLRGLILDEAHLHKAILYKASLRDASLREADLREADLRHADLRGVHLNFTNLEKADLRFANLEDVDLSYNEAENEWSAFLEVQYNRHTRWPPEFDPTVLRAVYVD